MKLEIPSIDYTLLFSKNNEDIISGSISQIRETGIILISDVPELERSRKEALTQIYRFGILDEKTKEKYVDPESNYMFGWACGKERLRDDRQPDAQKGSYYFNLHDHSSVEEEVVKDNKYLDVTKRSGAREYYRKNLWPMEELPQMKEALMSLADLIKKVTLEFIRIIDGYLSANLSDKNYVLGTLEKLISNSKIHKARALCYFPSTFLIENRNKWCNEHFDHSIITGLVSAMFIENGNQVSNPDPTCGLYIRDHLTNSPHKVDIPNDSILFQFGETMHVLTGGYFKATSHWVTPPLNISQKGIDVYRLTLAVFFSPELDVKLEGLEGGEGLEGWFPGMTFGQFSRKRVSSYYD